MSNFIISFPRSGQHLVESVLNFICKEHGTFFKYCEYYTCCKKTPCELESNVQKNHDFSLEFPINENWKYVILYRKDPILQLEACSRYMNIDNTDEKIEFIKEKWWYYDEFVKKWCCDPKSNILVFDYYDLLENPTLNFKLIFSHFFPEAQIIDSVFENITSEYFSIDDGNRNFYTSSIHPPKKMDQELYNQLKEMLNNE